jgi:hypothetical protein
VLIGIYAPRETHYFGMCARAIFRINELVLLLKSVLRLVEADANALLAQTDVGQPAGDVR